MAEQLFALVIFYLVFKGLNVVIGKTFSFIKGLKKNGSQ